MCHCPAEFFSLITVEVYEAHAKTCTFLECLLVPYLCVFYCDVVELGSYGNLKYYDTMTEEGKKYFRIACISFFEAFSVFTFSFIFSCSVFSFSIFELFFLHDLIDSAISCGSFFQVFIFNFSVLLLSDKEIQLKKNVHAKLHW